MYVMCWPRVKWTAPEYVVETRAHNEKGMEGGGAGKLGRECAKLMWIENSDGSNQLDL